MQKKLSYIIISALVAVIFLAPVSGDIKLNKTSAQGLPGFPSASLPTNTADGWYYFSSSGSLSSRYNDAGSCTLAIPSTTSCFNASSGNIVQNSYIVGNIITPATLTAPVATPGSPSSLKFGCYPTTIFTNCLVEGIYYIGFEPMAGFAHLAGSILDFFVYYSINGGSYASSFIGIAWASVRDIANIFFIIALLYIAISTILDLGGAHGKKMIATIVVVALLINFSLFFTQVIIDSSNILAHVFYNHVAATTVNGTTNTLTVNPPGDVSISVAIAAQFDPQQIFNNNNDLIQNNIGLFAFTTLLSILLMGFMIYIFSTIAFLFVGRVASLWIAMIFAPIAFASYTLPFDIPGLGHKEWWGNLLKNAFLAPIFIFLLYVIFLFKNAFLDLHTTFGAANTSTTAGMFTMMMGVVIPFALVTILLMKAKELAVKYSGEIGAMMNKVGGTVGGFATGAIVGAYAGLGRATIGRAGAAISQSARLKKLDGKVPLVATLRNVATFAGKSSFDVRGTGMTPGEMGKAPTGGFVQKRADKMAARQERAKNLEVGPDEKLAKDVRTQEVALDDAKSDPTRNANIAKYTKDVADNEKSVAKAERDLKDAIDKFKGNSPQADAARRGRDVALGGLDTAKNNLKAEEKPIKDAEKALIVSQNLMTDENKQRGKGFAKVVKSRFNKTVNFVTSGGQHSSAGADESADKIRARSSKENVKKEEKH